MSRRSSAKYKISRQLGESLWGRAKDPVNRRSYKPGQQGPNARRAKLSDFGTQLRAKQKLKKYYGDVTEKQFLRTYKEAVRQKGDTSENLIGLLEQRLDAVIYRMGVVPTVFAARQFVNHNHIKVNGKKMNISSYRVQVGDVIVVKEKSRQIPMVLQAMGSPERSVPDYIEVDGTGFEATFKRIPQLMDVPYPVQMEPNLVVEFYSR